MASSEQYLMEKIMKLSPPPPMGGMGAEMTPQKIQQMSMNLLKQAPKLISKLSKMDPSSSSDQFKLTVVQFFIQYYTVRMFELAPPEAQMGDPNAQVDLEKVEAFKADQTRDMEYAWRLLRARFRSPEMHQTAKLLMIEIGQRLEDSVKLSEALTHLDESLEALGGIKNINFSPQQMMMDPSKMMAMQFIVVAFTACPLIGQFKKFIQLGDLLPPQEMERFSMISQSMPVPDYAVLYRLAKEENAGSMPVPDPSTIPWTEYYIESIRVKFRDLDCEEFTEKRQELLDEIHATEENVKWEEVPNPNNIHLKRMGCIFQCVSFAEAPQQLCGIFKEDRINVKGKTQAVMSPPDIDPEDLMSGRVQVDQSQLQILVQEESWDLTRSEDDEMLYKGTYEMHNYTPIEKGEKVTDPEKAPLHMTFDLELRLCTVERHRELLESGENEVEALVDKVVTDFDELELD